MRQNPRRLAALLLCALTLLGGCARQAAPAEKQYTATFLTLFDTVTSVVGRAASEEEFRAEAEQVRAGLERYHRLFDVYEGYEDMNNLHTVNSMAGVAPVQVDGEIIALLKDCRAYCEASHGRVNAAMGSVLSLWHEARTDGIDDPANARLPDEAALREAAKHTSFDAIVIDENASTVFITDPESSLDVGAIAKGWAVERVAESAPEGLLISVGGNVRATGPKAADGAPWVVGIRNPDGGAEDYLHTIYVPSGSVVTSGDYQRGYRVNGENYHHIIDPDTLLPGRLWRAVTIVCEDSGLADMLSTALFLLPQQEGQALLDAFGAQALWVQADGGVLLSPGFEKLIRT